MAYQTGPIDLDTLPSQLAHVNPQDMPARVRIGLDGDPARSVQGAPPNYGEDVIPQIMTYAGIWSSAARTYDITDEATRHSLENSERMRTELAIEECLERRRQALAGLPWHIEPEDPKSPRQREIAGVLTNLLERGPRFSRMIKTLALGIWFGRYATAMNYAFDIIGGANRNVLRAWKPVNGDKLLMRYSDGSQNYADGQVGIRVSSMLIGKVPDGRIEPTQHGLAYFLHNWERELYTIYRHDIEDGAWWIPQDAGKVQGIGIRDKIYWTWLAMSSMEQDILTWISRAAYGVRIWRYPSGNAKAKAEVEAAIKNALSNGVADIMYPVVPGEDAALFGLEQIEPGTAGVQAVLDLIQGFYSKKIKRYILGQTVTSETDPEGIGGGAWQAKMSTFADIMREDAEAMSEVVTLDYVRKLLRLNFPEYANCYMRFVLDTDDPKVEERMAAVQAMYQMDVPIVAEELYKLTGLTRPTPDDEVVQLSQTQQKQAAAQAASQPQPPQGPQSAPGDAPADEGLMPADQQQGPVVDAEGGEPEQAAAIAGGADVDVYAACPCPQGKCACRTMGGLQQWREEAARLLPKSRGVLGSVAGLEVRAVDGDQVKVRHDMDFVEGGNHEVYAYVPEGQVWVDGALPPDQRRHIALHEAVEATLMGRHGWTYDQAHQAANRVEKAARQADEPDPQSAAGQLVAKLTGGQVEGGDVLPGGVADNAPDSQFDPQALEQGRRHEMEHTSDPEIAGEIAKDHLAERGDYYDRLEQMEGGGLRDQFIAVLTGQPERYAARRVKSSPGQRGLFDESDHPRGQPDNAGQFVAKDAETTTMKGEDSNHEQGRPGGPEGSGREDRVVSEAAGPTGGRIGGATGGDPAGARHPRRWKVRTGDNWPSEYADHLDGLVEQLPPAMRKWMDSNRAVFCYSSKADIDELPPSIRGAFASAAAVTWNNSRIHFMEGKQPTKETLQHEMIHLAVHNIPSTALKAATDQTIADGKKLIAIVRKKEHLAVEGFEDYEWKWLQKSLRNIGKSGDKKFGLELDLMIPRSEWSTLGKHLGLPCTEPQYMTLAVHLAMADIGDWLDDIPSEYKSEEPAAYRAGVDDDFANSLFAYTYEPPEGKDAGYRPVLHKRQYGDNWHIEDENGNWPRWVMEKEYIKGITEDWEEAKQLADRANRTFAKG